jgi:branched-chain amino acid transport system ATP-binding protein
VSALAVEDVAIAFGGVAAVAGVSFAVEPGEIFAIIGPNGAGKTTLFNLIAGNYRPSRGRVTLGGDDVTGLSPHLLAQARPVAHVPEPADLLSHDRGRERDGRAAPARAARAAAASVRTALGVAPEQGDAPKAESCSPSSASPHSPISPPATCLMARSSGLEIARALATEPKVLPAR